MMEYHDLGYGSWGMDRIARWGMDRGMDRGVWIACGPGPLIHTLYFNLHPYIYMYNFYWNIIGAHAVLVGLHGIPQTNGLRCKYHH